MTPAPLCRSCGAALSRTLVDLGSMPLANSYVRPQDIDRPDPCYPLHARVCDACFLVQVEDAVPPSEIFSDYAYFSSYSASWVEQCRSYAVQMTERLGLGPDSRVLEIASNDGYLLQHFVALGIPVLGIEPAANVAAVAIGKGVATEVAFFGLETARRLRAAGWAADLMASNNVLAHVPDVNDFVSGIPVLLKPDGVWTIEFPHLVNLLEQVQFDTIYHEHYSYLSLLSVETMLARHGLRVFDVELLPTHGGSLRVFACHASSQRHGEGEGLRRVRTRESAAGLDRVDVYAGFDAKVRALRSEFLAFLDTARAEGRTVAAYGAAAKGNTLLNYCGVGPDLVQYVVDRNPVKQGRYLPGSRLPIYPPDRLAETRPDYVLILPWNLEAEIRAEMAHVRAWGGRFVIAVPTTRVLD